MDFKTEKTFVMIKPDGVTKRLIGEIISRFECRDLKVVALEMFQPTFAEMDEHYPKDETWIRRLGQKTLATYEKYGMDAVKILGTKDDLELGKMVRKWLVDYMISAPLVRLVIEGNHAVDMVRKICGNTMPYLAEVGTIRGDFSADSPDVGNSEKRAVMNLVHASETASEAEHEIKHWFGDKKIYSYGRFVD